MLFLTGCVTQGLLSEKETISISRVVVTKGSGIKGSVNLREDIRVKTLREARKYPRGGPSKTVRVSLETVHFKNAGAILLTGDISRIVANVALIDNASGRSSSTFKITAVDRGRHSSGLAGILITGFESELSAEQRLAGYFATAVMQKIYGSNRSQNAVAQGPVPNAKYPARYEDLERKHKCGKEMKFPTSETSGGDDPEPPKKCT